MTPPDYVTVHFILTLFLLDFILGGLKKAYYAKISAPGTTVSEIWWTKRAFWLFVLLAFVSFGHTWYHMFKYMTWSFAEYHRSNPRLPDTKMIQRVTLWLKNTNLFKEAWTAVSKTPLKLWWSEQLCLFVTGAWTIFLTVNAKSHEIHNAWAYMVLGQLVGISVASNLFYAAVVVSKPKPGQTEDWHVGPLLYVPVMLSLSTVYLAPSTVDHWTFLPNLFAMHALPIIPLLVPEDSIYAHDSYRMPSSAFSLNLFYRVTYVFASGIHVSALTTLFLALDALRGKGVKVSYAPSSLAQFAWEAVSSHPAQLWNAWDVVWTSVGFIAWVLVQGDVLGVIYLLCAMPVASLGGVAPFILRRGEDPEIATLWNEDIKPRLIVARNILITGIKTYILNSEVPTPAQYMAIRDQDAEQKWGVQDGRAPSNPLPPVKDQPGSSRSKTHSLGFLILLCAIFYGTMQLSILIFGNVVPFVVVISVCLPLFIAMFTARWVNSIT